MDDKKTIESQEEKPRKAVPVETVPPVEDDDNVASMLRLLAGRGGWGWGRLSAEEVAAADPEGKVRKLLDWSDRPRDIADPWYTHDFDTTYADVLEGCQALLDAIAQGRA